MKERRLRCYAIRCFVFISEERKKISVRSREFFVFLAVKSGGWIVIYWFFLRSIVCEFISYLRVLLRFFIWLGCIYVVRVIFLKVIW